MKYIKLFEEFSEKDLDIYEHGLCERFALALHEELDYTMYFYLDYVYDMGDSNFEGEVLVHAYATDNEGNMFDASGQIEEDYLDDHAPYVNDGFKHKINSKKEFDKFVDSGFISEYSEEEIKELRKYIRENIDKYSV